jgi:hypothetical protein
MAEKQREANEFIAHHRLRYAGLTLRRVLNTWTGLWEFPPPWNMDESGVPNILMYSFISCLAFAGLVLAIRHGCGEAIPLVFLPVFLPAIYYLTHSDMGFRHPIDPVLVIFMAYAIVSIGAGKQQQNPELHPVSGLAPRQHATRAVQLWDWSLPRLSCARRVSGIKTETGLWYHASWYSQTRIANPACRI